MDVSRKHISSNELKERQTAVAIEQGIRLLENDEMDKAIECFTEAIRLSPECARAYRLRGQAYSEAGKWANAERDIAKARRTEAKQA